MPKFNRDDVILIIVLLALAAVSYSWILGLIRNPFDSTITNNDPNYRMTLFAKLFNYYCMRISRLVVSSKRAFSLVELSIVLVILGLLVGGILAGQSLIRAAELRSISTDLAKHQTAINSFRDKYLQLPGDFSNATKFWSVAGGNGTGTDSACFIANEAPTNVGTCNGNAGATIHYTTESWIFWEHLSLAGLVEGSFAGGDATGATGKILAVGVNLMPTKLSNVGIQSANRLAYGKTTNYLIVGGNTYTGTLVVNPAVKSEEAWNLDTKMDDGQASYGKIFGANGFNGTSYVGCTNGSRIDLEPPGSVYNLQAATPGCALYFEF